MLKRSVQVIMIVLLLCILLQGTAQAKIIHIAVGHCVLALDDSGHVWAWGSNRYGELGIGTTGGFYGPNNAQKVLIDNVSEIATDGVCCFALKTDGTVWAWGYGGEGRLGYGSSDSQSTPVQVKGLTDIVEISASGLNGFALKNDGTVYAWGYNKGGELGGTYGIPEYVDTPMLVDGLADIVALGDHGNYAIKRDGTVYAWGDNVLDTNQETGNVTYGFLGDPSGPGERPVPFPVPGVSDAKQITNGDYYSIYLKNDGTVWGWGFNQFGELGDGTKYTFPVRIEGDGKKRTDFTWVGKLPPVQAKITGVKQISASSTYSSVAALKNDGTVWEWGSGTGPSEPVLLPVQRNGIDRVTEVETGYATIVLKDDGTVWGWGVNSNNVLKDSATDGFVSSPILLFREPSVVMTPSPTLANNPIPDPTAEPSLQPSLTPSGSAQPIETTASPSKSIVPTPRATEATNIPVDGNQQPIPTVTVTPVPLPGASSEPAAGFDFHTIALLGLLIVAIGLPAEFARRKDR